jgi:hypothetical protein
MKTSGRHKQSGPSESIEFVPKRELDRAQQEIERLRKENERLTQESERLRRELEAALRASKRQAASHSGRKTEGQPKAAGPQEGSPAGMPPNSVAH